jgi:transcriptional regulator with XRE-family HTH domain
MEETNMATVMKVRRVQEVDVAGLSQKIRQARENKGLSISGLGKASGISRKSLSNFELGHVEAIAYPTLKKLEDVLETDFGIKFE